MMLSPNFTLEEMTASQFAGRNGIDNTPSSDIIDNLKALAAKLESIRFLLRDLPVLISSGYRSPAVNAGIGGAHDSAHLTGFAADFTCPRFGANQLVAQTIAHSSIPFDQLILEYGWIHISVAPAMRRMLLTKHSAASPYQEGLIA